MSEFNFDLSQFSITFSFWFIKFVLELNRSNINSSAPYENDSPIKIHSIFYLRLFLCRHVNESARENLCVFRWMNNPMWKLNAMVRELPSQIAQTSLTCCFLEQKKDKYILRKIISYRKFAHDICISHPLLTWCYSKDRPDVLCSELLLWGKSLWLY